MGVGLVELLTVSEAGQIPINLRPWIRLQEKGTVPAPGLRAILTGWTV